MFEAFKSFEQITDKDFINTPEEFMAKYEGKTFLSGLYRIHKREDVNKWNGIIAEAFSISSDSIQVFGYDWAGRNFAVYKETGTVIICEPGTGEAFDTGKDFEQFHDEEIPQNHAVCLMSEYFQEWKETNPADIAHNECVGYKVPLFLNGKDEVANLEISDMEVYWEIMIPLIKL